MKKVTTLFFLCILVVFSFSNKDNEKTILVNYVDDNFYQKVYLNFNNNILNTKNFYDYFDENIKVISFYIFKNKKNCINGTSRYLFRFRDLENNIEGYESFYSKLYNTRLSDNFNGFNISIVEVYIDTRSLNYILNKNINIKYSNDICGNYQ